MLTPQPQITIQPPPPKKNPNNFNFFFLLSNLIKIKRFVYKEWGKGPPHPLQKTKQPTKTNFCKKKCWVENREHSGEARMEAKGGG